MISQFLDFLLQSRVMFPFCLVLLLIEERYFYHTISIVLGAQSEAAQVPWDSPFNGLFHFLMILITFFTFYFTTFIIHLVVFLLKSTLSFALSLSYSLIVQNYRLLCSIPLSGIEGLHQQIFRHICNKKIVILRRKQEMLTLRLRD